MSLTLTLTGTGGAQGIRGICAACAGLDSAALDGNAPPTVPEA